MFKILLVERTSVTKALYSTYKVTQETDGTSTKVDFETDDQSVLEDTIRELLETTPKNQIIPVDDLGFMVDVIIGKEDI